MTFQITTAQDLIRLALIMCGALGQGEDAPADDAQDALVILNTMLDSWNAQSLAVYTVSRDTFQFPTLKQVYTLGDGGDFDIPRPPRIEGASIILNPSANSSELPMDVINFNDWQKITVKTTQSPIPRVLWPDYAFPLNNLSFWPIPNANNTFVLYSWSALGLFQSITADVIFPAAYREAILYNLGLRLFVAYGRPATDDVKMLARTGLGVVKRLNAEIRRAQMQCDAGLLSKTRAFNWLTGETS